MEMQHETRQNTGGEQRIETASTEAEAVMPPPTEEERASISNQETEKAAMIKEGAEGPFDSPTTKPMKFESSIATAGMIFAMPATPPNRGATLLTTKSASNSRSSSLKKQRRGSKGSNGTATNGSGGAGGGATAGQPLNYSKNSGKQSQSMSSLQPNEEEHQEHRRDVIQAKLHMERPYNSLKKNAHSGGGGKYGNKMHRYSWGQSSQSSSNSLHSSATLGLGSSGKDDLWAAIQTNYNYIMDTNLLDTCKEARCEIEGASTVLEKSTECCLKMLDETQRPDGVLCEDPKELRRWLREMENKLEISPTITELTLFGNAELQRHLAVHSVLYHEIVSHARVVSSCIRAAEKEQQLQQQQQQQQLHIQQQQQQQQQPASLTSNCSSESAASDLATKSSSLSSGFASDTAVNTPIVGATAATAAVVVVAPPPPPPTKKGEGNLERLRDRYHLLYLKAFELQLCLDNLLRKRSSTANGLDDDEDEDEDVDEDDTEDDSFGYEGEGDAATEDDLNEVNSDLDLEQEQELENSLPELILQRCHVVAATEIVTQSSHISQDQPRDCLASQKILKSADASSDDDDEGWHYTATATTATATTVETTGTTIVDGLQSTAVSSTTSSGGKVSSPSDDSDKENKEALVSTTTTAAAAAAASGGATATATVSATVVATTTVATSSSNYDSSSACSSSNSNGRHTETSATSRVTQMQRPVDLVRHHQQQMQKLQMQMEFQSSDRHIISNNNCYSHSHIHKELESANNNEEGAHDVAGDADADADADGYEGAEVDLHRKMGSVDETTADMANGNATKSTHQMSNQQQHFYSRADICNISVWPSEAGTTATTTTSNGNRNLPPRSPAKSAKSSKSQASSSNATMSASLMLSSPVKVSHDSIKQLVLEAEHLVRDAQEAALKTPTKQKHSIIKISSTVKKREVHMPPPIKQRVEEWLEHQPSTPQLLTRSHTHELLPGCKPDDCEASGEASETDSVPQTGAAALNGGGSDTSEGFTDSIATCMQTSTNSYGNSTERIGGSAEPIGQPVTPLGFGSSNQSLNVKIVKRPQARRKSERPWSVSCLSQLTTDAAGHQLTTAIVSVGQNAPPGLASHSISESALDSLSPGPRPRAASSSGTGSNAARKSDSKGSLRRRKARKKRISAASAGRKSDSGSEAGGGDLTQTLMKSCESMSSQQLQEFTNALLSIQKGAPGSPRAEGSLLVEGDSESQLMLPKFRVGSFTTAGLMATDTRLGALAALSNYMNEDEQQAELSTEDHHSSISETAWDNYQEKYNSENYSEGFDSDAARRLLEFGDDYRNFIDSQSDGCSSLSAANNLDSFSPPRMDSLQRHELKPLAINQETISSSVDHARRQRALELQYERRRKTLEVRRKSCQDMDETISNTQKDKEHQNLQAQPSLSASATALMTPPANQQLNLRTESVGRKLDFGAGAGTGMSHSAQSLLRRTSESDTSTRRRRTVTADERRRSSRNLEKCIKLIPASTGSSSSDDSEDGEQEMRSLLQQSRDRLEDTRALKIRCHLLRPEDYNEIINTCRDNIRCLEAVLRGPPGTVLSNQCAGQTKDLLSAWEDLLSWSENASAARRLQQEMSALKHTLQRLGDKPTPELLDTEPAIQIAVEALKSEQSQLSSYRTHMLRLNASVHSWLTRQERRLQSALEEQHQQQIPPQESERTVKEEKSVMKEEQELEQSSKKEEQSAKKELNGTVAITVTDSNGNQVESLATGEASTSTGAWDVHSLMSAEQEFHKHLKSEVSDMYSAWDEADARINTQLEMLTASLIAWRQLESGLSEFHLALGQDRGTLAGLEGALDKGQTTPVELAQNVKLVAKLLSEKVHVSQEQMIAVQQHLDPNQLYHIAKFTASNGSLSDSGISDGGATSDGGLSERERRLGVLRRLAKQLELALAPGSEAMRSIAARMESAEAELKHLQNTCRDLIVRTAASHQQQQQQQQQVVPKANGHVKKASPGKGQAQDKPQSPGKRRNARKGRQAQKAREDETEDHAEESQKKILILTSGDGGGDPSDDPSLVISLESGEEDGSTDVDDGKVPPRGWAWRIARAAVPMQLALITFFCAACLMQPNCCDNLNNLSMSFTPQLRYIRGPPPI
ncbi:serine-rich adhesin for platelets isoform X4 [Drosophila guanche]|uniref:serine-rich adhesin for platelets isoform X4 n=1 Tax=Drosophila guanche TaxID=7266 RepID=UPI00147158CF|nr:serine-rich adhesin for platelets isoform X4 [Drosophila guanche]